MDLAAERRRVGGRLADVRSQVAALQAEAAGLEDELCRLQRPLSRSSLAEMTWTEAILQVVRRSHASLTPAQVTDRLQRASGEDDAKVVTSTLLYLWKRGLVDRYRRGQYVAAA